jgi:hypothetical protein
MKKRQMRPLEIVSDQIVKLQERLESVAGPREKDVLVRRLDNLKMVLEFLASRHAESVTAGEVRVEGWGSGASAGSEVIRIDSPDYSITICFRT